MRDPNICTCCGGRLTLVRIYSLEIGGIAEAIKCILCARYIWIATTTTRWAEQYVPVEAEGRSGARLERVINNITAKMEKEKNATKERRSR